MTGYRGAWGVATRALKAPSWDLLSNTFQARFVALPDRTRRKRDIEARWTEVESAWTAGMQDAGAKTYNADRPPPAHVVTSPLDEVRHLCAGGRPTLGAIVSAVQVGIRRVPARLVTRHLGGDAPQQLVDLGSKAMRNRFPERSADENEKHRKAFHVALRNARKQRGPAMPRRRGWLARSRVQEIMRSTKLNTSSAASPWWPPKAIRAAAESPAAIEAVADMTERVFESRRLPQDWQRGVGALLPKKTVPTAVPRDEEEFRKLIRGVTVCHQASKVFERVMTEEILEGVIDLLPQSQVAYLRRRSGDEHTMVLVAAAYAGRTSGKCCALLAIDLSSAFDRISPWLLGTWLLLHTELPLDLIELVVAWMTTRIVRARVRTVAGELRYGAEVRPEAGAPQGTVPGPIVFIISLIRLSRQLSPEDLSSIRFEFSDDGNLLVTADSYGEVEEALQNFINVVHQWAVEEGHLMRAAKCKILDFTRRTGGASSSLRVVPPGATEPLELVDAHSILGLMIDWKLRFEGVEQEKRAHMNRAAGVLATLRRASASVALVREVWNGVVDSKISRDIGIWFHMLNDASRADLERTWTAAVRRVFAPSLLPRNDLLHIDVGIPTLANLARLRGTTALARVLAAPGGRAAAMIETLHDHAQAPFCKELLSNLEQLGGKIIPTPVEATPWNRLRHWGRVIVSNTVCGSQPHLDFVLQHAPNIGRIAFCDGRAAGARDGWPAVGATPLAWAYVVYERVQPGSASLKLVAVDSGRAVELGVDRTAEHIAAAKAMECCANLPWSLGRGTQPEQTLLLCDADDVRRTAQCPGKANGAEETKFLEAADAAAARCSSLVIGRVGAHAGVHGNEACHAAAATVDLAPTDDEPEYEITPTTVKLALKKQILSEQNEQLDEAVRSGSDSATWYKRLLGGPIPARVSNVYAQVAEGSWDLLGARLKRSPQFAVDGAPHAVPQTRGDQSTQHTCPFCNMGAPDTVEHFLSECPYWVGQLVSVADPIALQRRPATVAALLERRRKLAAPIRFGPSRPEASEN